MRILTNSDDLWFRDAESGSRRLLLCDRGAFAVPVHQSAYYQMARGIVLTLCEGEDPIRSYIDSVSVRQIDQRLRIQETYQPTPAAFMPHKEDTCHWPAFLHTTTRVPRSG